MVMPLLLALFATTLGFGESAGWRLSMVTAGAVCALAGVAYYFLTQDTPEGNFRELRSAGRLPEKKANRGAFLEACRDRRVWALFAIYGASFGIELTIDNVAALYFLDYFPELRAMDAARAMQIAGVLAGLFGGMNLFARALGGFVGDKFGQRWGMRGRVNWLFLVVFCEGLALMLFSRVQALALAIPAMLLFALFVKMANGATYAVVPFVNRRALGPVSGIVGAGGNVGAVAAGFLFKAEAISWPTALFLLGAAVTVASFACFAVTFSAEAEEDALGARETLRERELAAVTA